MDKEKKSGYRTLLLSVLMSAYGPVILGLGLRVGHSSTQIADFTRRTAELLAFPGTGASFWVDRAGSVLVALYMIRCGIKTIAEQKAGTQ